jgi:hypothetical protein
MITLLIFAAIFLSSLRGHLEIYLTCIIQYFEVDYTNLERFMNQQNWSF